jgi:DNA polymerase III alpha subunit (gram-positive type)
MFLFVDTETGGLTPDFSLLTVAAAVTDQEFNILDQFCFSVKPDFYVVSPDALKVNKIDLIEHAKTAMTQTMAATEFRAFLLRGKQLTAKNRLIPVGHNIHFDLGFLWAHILPESEWRQYCTVPAIDTASTAQLLSVTGHITGSCSLVALRNFFNITTGAAHNAANDVLATIELAKTFTTILRGLPKS